MVALHRFNLMIVVLRQWGCLSPRRLASCLTHDSRIIRRRPTFLDQSGRVGTTTTHASAVDRRPAASGGTAEEDAKESSSTTTTRLISFFTDIEGDRDYLQRYVAQSKVLCWRNNNTNTNDDDDGDRMTMRIDFREPHGHDMAVFGGDIWDQGGHDLWCLRQLLDLRRRYPDRFYCILGNRDVNKMRLAYELHNSAEKYPPRGVFFKGDKPNPTFATRGERLRHILQATMGSPRAFEYRRQELQEQKQLSGGGEEETIVTDDDVVDSYRDQCDPKAGALIDYIERSALLLQFGQVAFLHGALPVAQINTDNNKSWKDLTVVMPWLPSGVSASDVGVHTIGDWIQALGAFVQSEVAAFRRHGKSYAWIEHGGYQGLCGGLIQYGMGMLPGRLVNPTIIYNRWGPRSFADDTEPRQFWDVAQTAATQEFFRQSGIKVICCGHQPTGEMPNTIRVDVDGEPHWIMACDTSYSGDIIYDAEHNADRSHPGREQSKSGRGRRAVSEVLIEQCRDSGQVLDVHCHGTLSDGSSYATRGLMSESAAADANQTDSPYQVGTPSNLDAPCGGKWWTQAAFADGSFLLAASKGFDYWSRIVR